MQRMIYNRWNCRAGVKREFFVREAKVLKGCRVKKWMGR
jgi:hypothetical protein